MTCKIITQSDRSGGMKYEMKLKLNKYQYLAVLDEALVIVTVDEDNNPVRYAIFDNKTDKENEE